MSNQHNTLPPPLEIDQATLEQLTRTCRAYFSGDARQRQAAKNALTFYQIEPGTLRAYLSVLQRSNDEYVLTFAVQRYVMMNIL